jgi:hypothetical protein
MNGQINKSMIEYRKTGTKIKTGQMSGFSYRYFEKHWNIEFSKHWEIETLGNLNNKQVACIIH